MNQISAKIEQISLLLQEIANAIDSMEFTEPVLASVPEEPVNAMPIKPAPMKIEEARKIITGIVKDGHRDIFLETLAEFGTESLSALNDETKYAELVAAVRAKIGDKDA